ncbi:DUF6248 family natural product biosynthesis protein [Streptomonospora litoralis]|uniref:Uncharacterized protein n=1 Tax=Streptomonospora litoralis TaxID=2498135 RepID=A0A4P6Q8Q2_9ACTN|nr:DUF6248 family natural product biosynthesis protein [Streptomonospora litoralis]QBI56870.1 hypothetical protein EKD16_25650 [Streptomonospora litoralis]
MRSNAAAWVRENAWTPRMRRAHAALPGLTHTCGCQLGAAGHCAVGNHNQCQGVYADPKCETYLTDRDAYVRYWPSPRAPVQVWLAPVACRWLCPCECHRQRPQPAATPPGRTAVHAEQVDQPALF